MKMPQMWTDTHNRNAIREHIPVLELKKIGRIT